MGKKKTHEEFVKEVFEIRGDIYDFLNKYESSEKKVKVKHIECGHEWNADPRKLNSKKQKGKIYCPKCNGGVKISHDEFVENVIKIRGDIYEFLTKYESDAKQITIKHKECEYTWSLKANNLVHKSQKGKILCPRCNGGIPHNLEIFKREVYSLVKDKYIVLGDYINANVTIKMKHNIEECGYEFDVRPTNFINNNSRCPKCSGCMKKTTEQFKQEVYDLVGDEYEVLGEYVNNHTKIPMYHTKCERYFKKSPNKFLQRDQKCPHCATKSKGENKISKLLTDNNILFETQYKFDDCVYKLPLPFDFAILNKQNKLIMMVEYDGEQHFEPVDFANKGEEWAIEQFELNKIKDKIRNDYCKDNNILLYRIPYWKKDNIEEILKKLIHNEHVEVDETSFLVV